MTIHPQARIGMVHLVVRHLDAALAFYRGLGFAVLEHQADRAVLGVGGLPLLGLAGDPAAPLPGRATGLYHMAILLPSRRALAAALRHLAQNRVPLQGASDHLVSEALYLADPEGNGIEIYSDRPRAEWTREAGGIAMATRALDMDGLLAEPPLAGPWRMPAGTVVGHVHLRVNDIAAAESFYADTLGFEIMARYGHAASFVAAGGYHHHVGFNTWASGGAPPPPRGAAGLAAYEIVLPHSAALDAVLERLAARGMPAEAGGAARVVRDPAGNEIRLLVA